MDDASGLHAERPSQFGWPAWRQVTRRAAGQVGPGHLSIIAAGVAFQFFLALFPAIAAAVSIYGMVANPGDVQQAVEGMRGILPSQVIDLLGQQMTKISSHSGSALGIGALVGILVALWSANSGTKSLIEALDIAYHENEKRSFLRFNGISLLLTMGVIIGLGVAVALVVVLPALIDKLPLPGFVQTVVAWSRWPILAAAMMLALAVFYRYAPSRREPRWQWVSLGAVTATVLWLIASGIFSFYVSHSGSYNATYGSIAAIVILLMWLYISVFVVLFGASLNGEMERQTERDTTVGGEAPLGERRAYAADTVAAREFHGFHGPQGGARGAAPPRPRAGEGVGEIAQEVAQTRARMEETLRSIRSRATPAHMVDEAMATARRELHAGNDRLPRRPLWLGIVGLAAGAALGAALPRARGERPPSDRLH